MINAWMRYLSNSKNLSGIGLAVGAYTACLFVHRHYAPVRTAFLANWSQRSHLRATGLERMCWTQSEAITLLKRIHRKKQQKGNIFMNTYLERAPYRIHRRHDWGGYKIYDEIFRIGIFETPQILLSHALWLLHRESMAFPESAKAVVTHLWSCRGPLPLGCLQLACCIPRLDPESQVARVAEVAIFTK